MHLIEGSQTKAQWTEALVHMREALDILDEADAPPDIGTHLDLAVCRLEDTINGKAPETLISQLRRELERLTDFEVTETHGESEFA